MLIKGAAVLGEDFIFRKRDIAVEGGVFRAAGCNRGEILDGTGLFLLPGVLWLAVKGVLPNGAKPDKISCYKK